MNDDFISLLDPQGSQPPHHPSPEARPVTEAPAGRGIPEVTRPRSRLALPAMIAGAALVTGGFLYSVSRAGEAPGEPVETPVPPPAPPAPAAAEAAGTEPAAADLPADDPAPSEASPAPRASAPSADAELRRQQREAARQRAAERRHSPLVIELPEAAAGGARQATRPLGGADGAFLAAAGDAGVETARARLLANQHALLVQGTLVPGVLETAINSDLPGLLRAVVATDVTSFDGSRVLIPRGSRLIGQYRSGLAVGQTRVFVVWTRLVTPAGLSIGLGSPGTDALGRAGVSGAVDRHFVERFGAAILLSVIGSGAQAAANAAGRGDDITINAASDAARLAESALAASAHIAPTIRVRQGTPIRVLVARDLDFSTAPASGG